MESNIQHKIYALRNEYIEQNNTVPTKLILDTHSYFLLKYSLSLGKGISEEVHDFIGMEVIIIKRGQPTVEVGVVPKRG